MPVLVALASTISNGPRFHHHEPDYSTTIRTKFTFARQMKLKMKAETYKNGKKEEQHKHTRITNNNAHHW